MTQPLEPKAVAIVSFPLPALIILWSLCKFLSAERVTGYESELGSGKAEITMLIKIVNKPLILHLSGRAVLILQFVMILTIRNRASVSTNHGPR